MIYKTLLSFPLLLASVANAAEVPPRMAEYIDADLKSWVNSPQFVEAIQAQNANTAGLTEAEIVARDQEWQAQIGQPSTPLIDAVLGAPLSTVLKDHVAGSDGRITEIFVMDAHGLNVASSAVTSDYWQGDEAKFQETYGVGPGAVHVGEVELDESTQTYQGQVSFAITDPASPIGRMDAMRSGSTNDSNCAASIM